MLTSGFSIHRRGLRRVGLAVTACLLLLVTTGHTLSFHLETNLENLAFLNTLCGQGADCRSSLLPDGRFIAPDPLPDVWQHNDNLTACQALWLSRLQASTSLEAAQAKLVEAQDCNRHNLVTVWRGDLAWTGGQQEAAIREWANLSGSQLTERSYWLMLQGDIERSRAMLQVALNEEDPDIPPTEVKRLHVVLGHSYRLDDNWAEALTHYQKAWSLDPRDSEVVFYLGMSYRETGDPVEAARVLEDGLAGLPRASPGFVATYLIQLGSAYRELGNLERALSVFQEAEEWIQRESPSWDEQESFIQQSIAHLHSLMEVNPTPQ